MRLYDYSEVYIQLEELLVNGEIDQETFDDNIDAIEGSAVEKAQNVAKMIDNFQYHAAALKEEEDKLKAKRKTVENKINWLLGSLETFHKAAGISQAGIYKLRMKKLPPSVEILDLEVLPEAYARFKKEANKTLIKKAIQDGEAIPGAFLATDKMKFEVKK